MSFLDEIEAKFQTFDGPVYHVLGNHDMDSISNLNFSHIRAITGVRKENLIIPSYGTRLSLSCLTVTATRMVLIMIPVISIGPRRLSPLAKENGCSRN